MSIEILGYSAVVLGAVSAIPQLYQIFQTKKVRDINFLFFLTSAMSSFMYIIYGFIKKDYVMMSSAIMPLFLEVVVLILYLRYNKSQGNENIEIEYENNEENKEENTDENNEKENED